MVTAAVTTVSADGLVLAEPVEVLAELRRLAGTSPAAARARAPELVAGAAYGAWQEVLGEHEVTEADLVVVLDGLRRELWLWVKGNRLWAQVERAVAGRVARRLAG